MIFLDTSLPAKVWANVVEINKSSLVNSIMYCIRPAEYDASICIDYRPFLFPLLELTAVLSLLFRKGNVACQFERLLPLVILN